MRTKSEQEDSRRDELRAIEEALRALAERALKVEAQTGAYLITIAANEIRGQRMKP